MKTGASHADQKSDVARRHQVFLLGTPCSCFDCVPGGPRVGTAWPQFSFVRMPSVAADAAKGACCFEASPHRGCLVHADRRAFCWGAAQWPLCCLTFELSGHQRWDARPGLVKMYTVPPARAWRPAVGARLERGVRQHRAAQPQAVGLPRPCYFARLRAEASRSALLTVGRHVFKPPHTPRPGLALTTAAARRTE